MRLRSSAGISKCTTGFIFIHSKMCLKRTSGTKQKRRRVAPAFLMSRHRGRGVVLRVSPSQYREENERQDCEADGHAGALTEALGDIEAEHDPYDEAHKRNQEQDDPPDRSADDL